MPEAASAAAPAAPVAPAAGASAGKAGATGAAGRSYLGAIETQPASASAQASGVSRLNCAAMVVLVLVMFYLCDRAGAVFMRVFLALTLAALE
jgi:hypothetical protein